MPSGSLPPATARSARLAAAALDGLGGVGDELAGVEPAVAARRRPRGRRRRRRARRRARRRGCRAGRARRRRGRGCRRGRGRRPGRRRRRRPPGRRGRRRRRWPACGAGRRARWRSALTSSARLRAPSTTSADRHVQRLGRRRQGGLGVAEPLDRAGAGDGLDPAEVGADRALADDLQRADVAEGAHVGAAAQLGRVRAGLEHPDDVAVLVAEEGDGAERLGLGLRRLVVAHRRVGEDLGVGEVLDLADLLGREGVGRAEVEAQAVGVDERALLLHARRRAPGAGPSAGCGCRCGCGGWRRGGSTSMAAVASWPGSIVALDDLGRRGGAARAARRWCRAPRPGRCRCVIQPVSPTWPPDSA